MIYASQLWSLLAAQHSLLLLVGLVVGTMLVGRGADTSSDRQTRLRGAAILFGCHAITIMAAAGQQAAGYRGFQLELIALAFALLCLVQIGTTVVFRVVLPHVGLGPPRILVDLLTAVAVVIAMIVIGKRAGLSVAGLITTSAVLTAVIGFALQDTLGNIMGGLALQMDNSVKVGDWVSLGPGQPSGRVSEIRWRYTAIETRNWETVIIPNGVLMKSQVTIQGRRTDQPVQWRRHIEFFVDFRTPPSEVIAAVDTALRGDPVPNMVTTPLPNTVFLGIRDSYASYDLRYWLSDLASDDGTDSAVRTRLWFALRRAGIPLSIPASTVFLTHESDDRLARKAAEDLAERTGALAQVDLFRGLPDELRRRLGAELRSAPFAAGETVTQEGARDDGLYMIVRGEATVMVGAGAAGREVARLGAGQFFGEMSLMTGESRSATVIASTDLQCYRLDKPAFEALVHDEPHLAEEIAGILAARRVELSAVRGEVDEARRQRLHEAKQHILSTIRAFFGLAG